MYTVADCYGKVKDEAQHRVTEWSDCVVGLHLIIVKKQESRRSTCRLYRRSVLGAVVRNSNRVLRAIIPQP